LFDLTDDPAESKNLAGDPAFKDRLESMKQRLKAVQKETGDPWIMKWEYE
jgi:N-sulfoglucosamine sulfohydrolase